MPRRGKGFRVIVGLDAAALRKGFARAQAQVQSFGRSVKTNGAARLQQFSRTAERTGRTLTRSVTLPLVAAAAAASKFALEYQAGLTKVGTLTGLAQSEVRKLGESLKDVSAQSGIAIDTLTSGLLVAVSAGFRGTEALEITTSAAKLASLGFGELDTITRALTVTVENYGASGLSAARASDILLATAQQGNFDVSQLGDVFGRMLALSDSLGISIEEISSSFAALTRATGSATESQTQLSGILIQLVKPAESARAAYASIGTSIEEVRAQLGDEGLHATLVSITRRLREAGIDISKVFGRAQAIQGVTALTSAASTVPAILREISASTGEVAKQSAIWAETNEGKLKLALADTKNAAIELGEEILPVVASVLSEVSDGISGAADAFGDLTPATRKAILSIAGITAAAPIAALGLAKLTKGALALRAALLGSTGLTAALAPLGLTAAVGAAAVGWTIFKRTLDDTGSTIDATVGVVDQLTKALQEGSESLAEFLATPAGERDTAAISQVDADLQAVLGTLEAIAEQTGEFGIFAAENILPGVDVLRAFDLSDDEISKYIGNLKTRADDELAKRPFNIDLEIERGNIKTDFFERDQRSVLDDIVDQALGIFTTQGQTLLEHPAFQSLFSSFKDELIGTDDREVQREITQRFHRQIDEIESVFLGISGVQEARRKAIEAQLPPLFEALNDVGDTALRRILEIAAEDGEWGAAADAIRALVIERKIDIATIEDETDAVKKQSNGLRDLIGNLNAAKQATLRVATAQRTLRNALGLDSEVLQGEEALQSLITSQAEAALLTIGNQIAGPDQGFFDEFNARTIDAVQAWFGSIDRYAQSLGKGGEFGALDTLIAEQLLQLGELEDSLPEATYRRLVKRLDDISTSARDPFGTVGGAAAANPVLDALDEIEARLEGTRITIKLLAENPIILKFADIDLSIVEDTISDWQTYLASDAGSLGLHIDPAFLAEIQSLEHEFNDRFRGYEIDILIGEIEELELQKFYASIDAASLGIDVDSPGVLGEVDRIIAEIASKQGKLNLIVAIQESGVQAQIDDIVSRTGTSRETNIEDIAAVLRRANRGGGSPFEESPQRSVGLGANERAQIAVEAEASAARAAVLRLQAQGVETRAQVLQREAEERSIREANRLRDARAALLDSGGTNLAALARGGIVTRPTISMIGEGGEPEAIVPLSRAQEFGFGEGRGDQSITININGNFYGDEESFRDLVVDELRTHVRHNGTGSVGI